MGAKVLSHHFSSSHALMSDPNSNALSIISITLSVMSIREKAEFSLPFFNPFLLKFDQ